MTSIAFFDIELNATGKLLLDIGCVLSDGAGFHKNQPEEFAQFIGQCSFICGHNIIAHDLAYLQRHFGHPEWGFDKAIDTLLLSPLLFPRQPYHRLLKDDKVQTEERNNPLSDAKKARDLFTIS